MYRKILVPLDGSELAEVALPYAAELAGRISSEIILLSVSESDESQRCNESELYLEKMVDSVKRIARGYLEEPEGKEIKVEAVVLVGYPPDEIVDYAERESVGMIIMATHGRAGMRRWALGSVADKVVRATRQPVVLIRAKGAYCDMREKGILNTILVPLDGSKDSEVIIPYIEQIADRVKGEVILLRVVEQAHHVYDASGTVAPAPYTRREMEQLKAEAAEYLEKIAGWLRSRGISVRPEVRTGPDATEIIKFADELYVDLVAMATHRRTGAGQGAFWSVSDMVLRSGNTPIMLVRGP